MMNAGSEIYIIDKHTLDQLGEISEYKGVIFPKKFIGEGQFELFAPITPNNLSLIQTENLVYIDEDTCGEITDISTIINDGGEKVLKAKGKTLESLLHDRIVWGRYKASSKRPDEILIDLIDVNCVNPEDPHRVIPYLELCEISSEIELPSITHQQTGGEVYEDCKILCEAYNIGFSVSCLLKEKKLKLKLHYGLDKTIEQSDRDFVFLSTDMQDILSSEYRKNTEDYKTTALVAGEGEGDDRVFVTVGDTEASGFDRKELYVDARDLQSEGDSDYEGTLNARGIEKLGEQIISKSFKFVINPNGVAFVYGKDYFLGDTITVYDEEIGVQANVVVTEVEEERDGDKYTISHTFGFKSLKAMDKVRRLINNRR